MASALDKQSYRRTYDATLSPYDGPPPREMRPVKHTYARDNWAFQSDIWQGRAALPNLMPFHNNNRASAIDASAPMIGGSETMNDNSSGGSQVTSSSTSVLSTNASNFSVSPTRLRSNGATGSDYTSATSRLGRPSLLPGSAPDTDPSNFEIARPAFNHRQTSTIDKAPRPYPVGEAEDFMPSYLPDHEAPQYQSRIVKTNDTPGFTRGISGFAAGDYGSRNTILATNSRIPSRESIDHFATLHTMSRQASGPSANHASGMPTVSNHSAPYDVRARKGSGFGLASGANTNRNPSNLRPDVASYQPAFHNINHAPLSHQPHDSIEYTTATGLASYVRFNEAQSRAQNQHAIFDSHGAFSNNPLNGGVSLHRDQGKTYQPFAVVNFNNGSGVHMAGRSPNGSKMHPNSRCPAAAVFGPDPTGSDSSFQYQKPTLPHGFGNRHFEYLPETARTTPDERPYAMHRMTAPPKFGADGFCSSEPSTKNDARSDLLEEFRACHKSRRYELKDIYGYIVEFSGDQTGSRFIQTKLEQANSDEKEQIFAELLPNARQLMSDVFGNYVIQKMFEYGNQSQKKALAGLMQGIVMKLSLHAYGCRCVQKALEHILTDQQAELIREIQSSVLCVVESQHGNHVIQKAIECIPGEHIQFIIDAHRGHVVRLSQNMYGCRIVQRMLEYCAPNAKRAILDELHCAIPSLIDDQYGNYVIQCIIIKCSATDRHRVIEYVQRRLLHYSMHKFASNVVEKAIQYADQTQRDDLIRRLTGPDPENGMSSPLLPLLKDPYGNYVIQTVLRTTSGASQDLLVDEVQHHLRCMGKVGRSKQISAMIDTLAAIAAGRSPSSASDDPQTPRTPTSLNAAGNLEASLIKAIEQMPTRYLSREQQASTIPPRTHA